MIGPSSEAHMKTTQPRMQTRRNTKRILTGDDAMGAVS